MNVYRILVAVALTSVVGAVTFAAPATAAVAPDPVPMMIAPDPSGGYTAVKLGGGWSDYDSNQTLSVQVSTAGTFAWGDVIQQGLRAIIIGNVNASGMIYRNGAAACSYSKIGVASSYSFHGSCTGFKQTDLIIFNLTYTFQCIQVGNPCSVVVSKGFNVV